MHTDFVVGKPYCISYVDPNYPCRCACHTNNSILHCVPCCYNRSFGPILCQFVLQDENGYYFIKDVEDPIGLIYVPKNSIGHSIS